MRRTSLRPIHRTTLPALVGISLCFGCSFAKNAPLSAHELPPPRGLGVYHESRLVLELSEETLETQCSSDPVGRELCFVGVRTALERALRGVLKASFPEVRSRGDTELAAQDYLLFLDVRVEAIRPEADAMGWSAGARGHYQLSRGGVALAGAGLASRSRGGFGFDETLGTLGSEVVQAIAAHIGHVVVTVPESHPEESVVLPPVVTRDAFIVSQAPKGYGP